MLLSLALWVGVALFLVRGRRNDAGFVLPIAWFFITLLPVSNILFPIGVAKAERLMYLPSVGLCLLVGWAYARAEQRFQPRVAARLALAALLAVFTLRTARRNQDWKDSLTLALATLKTSPSSPLMNDIAAGELVRRGDARGALPLLQEAVRRAPYMGFARTHLGIVYFQLGRHDEAIAEYREALRLNPSDADAHNNLGVAYMATARESEAIAEFREAIRLNPGHVKARENLAALERRRPPGP